MAKETCSHGKRSLGFVSQKRPTNTCTCNPSTVQRPFSKTKRPTNTGTESHEHWRTCACNPSTVLPSSACSDSRLLTRRRRRRSSWRTSVMVMLSRSVASACSFSRCVCAGVHSEYYICGCVCVYIYIERERERETRIPVYAQVFTESIT